MGDKATTEQLHKAKKRREEWMKLMKDISEPLNDEIVKQKKKRQELYVAILEQGWKIHLARASKLPSDVQITKDLIKEVTKKAEDYTIVECKLIAFEEIDKLCQEIGNDVSFLADHKGNVKLDGSASAAVASVIYASHYCEEELPEKKSSEGENLREKLEKVRNKLAGYFGGDFELNAEQKTKQMTPKIKENLVKQPDPKKILEKVATVNHLRII